MKVKMKKLIIAAAMMLLTISSFAQSGKEIYRKFSDEKGVEAVYVSPAMFRLIKNVPNIKIESKDINLGTIIQSLEGMYILNCENRRVGDRLVRDVQNFIDGGAYELLMESKSDGELTRMYTVNEKETVTSFVLLSQDSNESNFVCVDGNIPQKALEELLEKATK